MVHLEIGAPSLEQSRRPSKCQQLLSSLLFTTAKYSLVLGTTLGSRDALRSQRAPQGPGVLAEEMKVADLARALCLGGDGRTVFVGLRPAWVT